MRSSKMESYERAAALAAMLTDELCKPNGKRELFPEQITHGAVELLGLADRLHHYAEAACNGELTPNQEKHQTGLANRVLAICNGWGIRVKFNGDPRGYAVKLLVPSKRYNTWGGESEGWGI